MKIYKVTNEADFDSQYPQHRVVGYYATEALAKKVCKGNPWYQVTPITLQEKP